MKLFNIILESIIIVMLSSVLLFLIDQVVKEKSTVADITPLHKVQQPRKCYSPFDIYITYDYELVDDNATLITSHGRVYNLEDCGYYND